jgi:hypothetical protein
VGGVCGTHGRRQKTVQGFGGKARGKETTRKTKAQMEDGIRMDLTVKEMGWGCRVDPVGSG